MAKSEGRWSFFPCYQHEHYADGTGGGSTYEEGADAEDVFSLVILAGLVGSCRRESGWTAPSNADRPDIVRYAVWLARHLLAELYGGKASPAADAVELGASPDPKPDDSGCNPFADNPVQVATETDREKGARYE